MRAHAARFVVLLAVALPAAAFDHHDPASLAARVRERATAGDFASARILQARAERIAPADLRVLRAREALEAAAAGRAVPPEGTAPAAGDAPKAQAMPAAAIPPAPPAPWRLP